MYFRSQSIYFSDLNVHFLYLIFILYRAILLLCFFHDASGLLANSHRKSFMTEVIVHYYIFLALWSVHP